MIRLDTTTRKLQVVLAAVVAANQLPVMVSYSDKTLSAYTGASQMSNSNSTTAVDICSAPAALTIRDIDYLSIRNADTAPVTATIYLNDNGTQYNLVTATLQVGDHLMYTHSQGWNVANNSGYVKTVYSGPTGPAVGGGSDQIFLMNGQTVTTSYTLPAGQNAVSGGPITINTAVTVSIPTGSTWSIV